MGTLDRSRPRRPRCGSTTCAATRPRAGPAGLTLGDPFSAAPCLDKVVLRPFEPELTIEYRLLWPDGTQVSFDRARLVALLRAEARKVHKRLRALMATDPAPPRRKP